MRRHACLKTLKVWGTIILRISLFSHKCYIYSTLHNAVSWCTLLNSISSILFNTINVEVLTLVQPYPLNLLYPMQHALWLFCILLLRPVSVEELVSLPLKWWISPCMSVEYQFKMINLERGPCSLILRGRQQNLTVAIDVLDCWKIAKSAIKLHRCFA